MQLKPFKKPFVEKKRELRVQLQCTADFFKGLGIESWPADRRGSPAYWLLWRVSLIFNSNPFLIMIPFKLEPFWLYSRKLLKTVPSVSLFLSHLFNLVICLWPPFLWLRVSHHAVSVCSKKRTTLRVWPGGCAMIVLSKVILLLFQREPQTPDNQNLMKWHAGRWNIGGWESNTRNAGELTRGLGGPAQIHSS